MRPRSVSIFHELMPMVLNRTEQLTPLGAIMDGHHPRWTGGLALYSIYLADTLVHWLRTAMADPGALAAEVDARTAPHCKRQAPSPP